MKAHRINNIELRQVNNTWEIVKWYPNPHYKRENEYIWDEDRQSYRDPNYSNWFVSPGCFVNPECCYVIATIKECNDEEPDILTVGARPFQLSHTDRIDMYKLLKYIYNENI